MPAARIFFQLVADLVVYVALLIRPRKAIAAKNLFLRRDRFVAGPLCALGTVRRALRRLCSQSYLTGAMRSLWLNPRR